MISRIQLGSREKFLKVLGWGVHAYTASGAVLGLLAIKFAADHRFRASFVMMAAATVIDSTDGVLARYFQVKQRLPNFDGALLDNIVDYLTYVVAPAYLMLCAGMLGRPLGMGGGQRDPALQRLRLLPDQHQNPRSLFLGFPSYWNLVGLLPVLLPDASGAQPAIIVALFAVLVFVPIKYIYPSRTELLRRLTISLGIIWAVLVAYLLLTLPAPNHFIVWLSFTFIGYICSCRWCSTRGPRGCSHRTRMHERSLNPGFHSTPTPTGSRW